MSGPIVLDFDMGPGGPVEEEMGRAWERIRVLQILFGAPFAYNMATGEMWTGRDLTYDWLHGQIGSIGARGFPREPSAAHRVTDPGAA